MQRMAAYLLERRDYMEWPEARASEAHRIRGVIERWLLSKGAVEVSQTGSYEPQDGSVGYYTVQEAIDGDRSWWMVELHEDNSEGRRVGAAVSVTAGTDRVSVFVSLEAGMVTSSIQPVSVDVRCPRLVHELLQLDDRWYNGGSLLRKIEEVRGFDGGENLAREIEHWERTIPILVISKHRGEVALPRLDENLGRDLTGIANVFVVDDEASWALTEYLGVKWCCYWGAVRLYWPHFSPDQDRFLHPLWTRELIQSTSGDPARRDEFRSQVRALIFRAAALSVVKPREIDSIRDAASRHVLTDLHERAESLDEYRQLAEMYAGENDQLRSERAQLRNDLQHLQSRVYDLENSNQALSDHLTSSRAGALVIDGDDASAGAGDDSSVIMLDEPRSGEVRYYKKVHSAPGHDVLVRTGDCGCNAWQGAHKAPKAVKGIAKLEDGRRNWKSLQKCGSCTGGGMWKVKW